LAISSQQKKKKEKKKKGCDIVVKLLANNGQLSATISNKNSSDHSGKIEPKDCLIGRSA
jgi:hypothetical protein